MEVEDEMFQLKCKIKDTERMLEEAEEARTGLNTEKQRLEEENERLKTQGSSSIQEQVAECERKDEEIKTLQAEVARLSEELKKGAEAAAAQDVEAKSKASTLDSQIADMQARLQAAEKAGEALQSETKTELAQKEERIAQLEKDAAAELEKQLKEIEGLTQQCQDKDSQLVSAREKAETELNGLREQCQSLTEKLEQAGKEENVRLTEKEAEAAEMRKQIEAGSAEIETLRGTVKRMDEEKGGLASKLQEEAARGAGEAQRLAQELKDAKSEVDRLSKASRHAEHQFSEETIALSGKLATESKKRADAEIRLQAQEAEHKSQLDELRTQTDATAASLRQNLSRLERELKNRPLVPARAAATDEQLASLREFYEQQLATAYAEVGEGRNEADAEEMKEIWEENSKVRSENHALKLRLDAKDQVLELVEARLKEANESFGTKAEIVPPEEAEADRYGRLYSSVETLVQHARRLEQQAEHYQLAASIAENRGYLLECCVGEAKDAAQHQTEICEELRNESGYYQELLRVLEEKVITASR